MKVGLTSFLVAALVAFLLGPVIIPLLRILRFGQRVRTDGPRAHLSKAGTPTMGGLMFLLAITIAILLGGPVPLEVYLALAVTMAYGLVGFADDFIKVALGRSLGLKARYKLIAQIGLGLIMGIFAIKMAGRGTLVPLFFSDQSLEMGSFYPFFAVLVLVCTTNAVNLTDGLDGLAAGTTLIAAAAYFFIALWQDQTG
ncbi:MAG TPA: phospho-N-acetylmuramoyl-pentapeptide-transferase, partial [Clostridia bacterium]|nr:phospho-N-acetylmuramoyl-pentapeptide-transferase [Clostridia bacterium]